MKPIEQNDETVTLQYTRQELRDLHNVLGDAMVSLEREPGILRSLIEECDGVDDPDEIESIIREYVAPAGREEQTVQELQKAVQRAERLLPEVYAFSKGLRDLF